MSDHDCRLLLCSCCWLHVVVGCWLLLLFRLVDYWLLGVESWLIVVCWGLFVVDCRLLWGLLLLIVGVLLIVGWWGGLLLLIVGCRGFGCTFCLLLVVGRCTLLLLVGGFINQLPPPFVSELGVPHSVLSGLCMLFAVGVCELRLEC